MPYAKLKSYSQAYRYLCQFTDYERMAKVHYSQTAYNLKRMKHLLQALGNPQGKLRCIHIAGTKGKGSTAIMLATILAQAGYKVGIYTSPHLVDLRERIQVWHMGSNNTPHFPSRLSGKGKQNLISKNDFTKLMNVIVTAISKNEIASARHGGLRNDSHCEPRRGWSCQRQIPPQSGTISPYVSPTFFETMTALAFLYFLHQNVNFAVIEVGLGGRLDATNLITPIVSVITRIDFDHMDKLGHTLKEIAREKSGIIKAAVPVISFRQKTPADKVIHLIAINNKAPLYLAPILKHNLPVQGAHQSENWSLALKAIEVMNKQEITDIGPAVIKSALQRLELPGRMELVSRRPDPVRGRSPLGDREAAIPNSTLPKDNDRETVSDKIRFTSNGADIIIDSAHNAVSIRATADTVKNLKYNKVILIFALSADKEIGKIISSIITLADIIIFTRTNHPRLMNPEGFIRYLPDCSDKTILIEPDYTNALSIARRLAQADDLILITGSFYLAGPVRELLATKAPRHEGIKSPSLDGRGKGRVNTK